MNYQRILLGALLVLVAVAITALLWGTFSGRADEQSEDFPQGTTWLCKDCDRGFRKSISELHEIYRDGPGGPVPCPHCGKTNTVRARQCPHCGAFFERPARGQDPKQSTRPACPQCGKALPRLTGGRE
jgi:hypothetical protein